MTTLFTNSRQIALNILFVLLIVPIVTLAQTEGEQQTEPTTTDIPTNLSSDGVYGCADTPQNPAGKQKASGAFVPVSEEAVAHNTNILVYNTNILVYKECVLDGIVASNREAAIAFMVKSTLGWANSNAEGEKAFVTNQKTRREQLSKGVVDQFTEGDRTEGIFEPYRDDIRQTLARGHAKFTENPEDVYKSTIPDDKKDDVVNFLKGRGAFSWDTFLLTIQPQNNPVGALSLSLRQMLIDIDEKITDDTREIDWGDGYKPHKNCRQIPAGNGTYEEYCEIVTPGTTIKNIINHVALTGQRQTENADEIDELMGSLMNNIHTQILTSAGGLSGISQPDSSGSSYVDRVSRDASLRVGSTYTNVGTNLLADFITTELAYRAVLEQSRTALGAFGVQIEAKELSCWDGILVRAELDLIEEVEALACNNAGGNCTLAGAAAVEGVPEEGDDIREYDVIIKARAGNNTAEVTIHIHPDNSSIVVDRNISPLLRAVEGEIDESTQAMAILTSYQASLLSSSTPGNTRFIMDQLQQLKSDGVLHTLADTQSAEAQHDGIVSMVEGLYTSTVTKWNGAWCNPENWRDQIKQ